jgi:signal transduction histidine kinase
MGAMSAREPWSEAPTAETGETKPKGAEAGTAEAGEWRPLAGRLAALASIAGEAAHRFNNLRAVIDGTLGLIAADPANGLTARRLERVQEAAARADALAAGIVALGRWHALSDIELDIAEWLHAAQPWLRRLAAWETDLTIEIPEGRWTLLADPNALRVALTALMLNAVAAVGAGGEISIRLTPYGNPPADSRPNLPTPKLSLIVRDNGPGMSPEIAARAREPFFTTRPPAAGLGLTVAEAFAIHRGGWLALTTGQGQGTTAALHLVG